MEFSYHVSVVIFIGKESSTMSPSDHSRLMTVTLPGAEASTELPFTVTEAFYVHDGMRRWRGKEAGE